MRSALERAASATWAVLSRTIATGEGEMALVAAQNEIVRPRRHFRAQPATMPPEVTR